MYTYAEFVTGGFKNRNNIFTVNEFRLNGIRTDCYRSIFLFDESFKHYVDHTKTVSGYAGKHIADSLVFDFDGENLEAVKAEVAKFCMYLHYTFEIPYNYLRLAFSGAKGFHLSIPFNAFCEKPEPKENFWQIYKSIAENISEGFNFVDSSIYEIRRIFRMTNTINSKTGLYKIPLTFADLGCLSVEQIKQLARQARKPDSLPDDEISEIPALKEMYLKWNSCNYSVGENREPGRTCSKRNEILDILKNGCNEGNRHLALIRLTALYAEKGFDFDFTLEVLKLWNEKNTPPLPQERLKNEALRAYNDTIERNKIDEKETEVFSMKEASQKYQEYVSNIDKVKIQTGYPAIDKYIRGLMPGETLCVLGKTSVGKSAFLQNIGMQYTKKSNEPVLFFSMEMPVTSVFERTMQIETGLSGHEVEKGFKENTIDMRIKAKLLCDDYHSFYTITKNGLNLEQIQNLIRFAEENIYHKKTGLILIDYLGLIKEKGQDLYEQVSKAARGMKDLAKEMNVPIIYLSQVIKKYTEFDELELGAARDSGSVDEASDFVLALWKEKDTRPEKEQSEFFLKLGILKNRKGGTGRIPIVMHKRSLKITEGEEQSAFKFTPAGNYNEPDEEII